MNMNKATGFLSVVLMAQLLLAGTLMFSVPDLAAVRPDTPLIELTDQSVDRLIIEGADNEKVVLRKASDRWTLPDHFGFPVENGKVAQLIEQLKSLQHGFPIATTSTALTRFKVTDKSFERRITLAQGNEVLKKIYLGSSPGIRRIHARTDENEAVYSVNFSAYQVPTKAENWEDKEILRFPQEDIEEIRVADLIIRQAPAEPAKEKKEKAEGAEKEEKSTPPKQPVWIAEGLGAGERLDEEGAAKLAGLLSGLRIARVMGIEPQAEYGLNAPRLSLSYRRKNAEIVEYVLGKAESGTDFVLKASQREEYFRLDDYTVKPLLEAASRDKLAKNGEKDDTPVE
ncbi:MAG: DUF4340 domain-containing protein [Gammaproteobacteria bacterium]|nr:DUF4340 domain-containing protein [Gammaproteobacteria bacterium]